MCILMLTPFLFNNSFFDWRIFLIKVNIYLQHILWQEIFSRSTVEIIDFNVKAIVASYIFAYSPLLTLKLLRV